MGTAVAATDFLPMSSNTMEVDPGWFSPQTMMGVRDRQVFSLHGERKVTGSIAGPLFPSNGIPMLAAAIGNDTITGSTAPYTHTIAQAQSLHSLTIEKNIGGFQSLQFAGCKVGKFTVKAAAGNEAASISADISGQNAAILTSPTAVSITNEAPFVFAEATVDFGGLARAEVSSIQLDIDNGLKETYTFNGDSGPAFITPVSLHVSGTVDLVFSSLDDTTYGDYSRMVAALQGSLGLTLTQPGGMAVELTVPATVLSKYSNDLKVEDVVMSTLTFEALYSQTSSYTIQAVVTNGVATAY